MRAGRPAASGPPEIWELWVTPLAAIYFMPGFHLLPPHCHSLLLLQAEPVENEQCWAISGTARAPQPSLCSCAVVWICCMLTAGFLAECFVGVLQSLGGGPQVVEGLPSQGKVGPGRGSFEGLDDVLVLLPPPFSPLLPPSLFFSFSLSFSPSLPFLPLLCPLPHLISPFPSLPYLIPPFSSPFHLSSPPPFPFPTFPSPPFPTSSLPSPSLLSPPSHCHQVSSFTPQQEP